MSSSAEPALTVDRQYGAVLEGRWVPAPRFVLRRDRVLPLVESLPAGRVIEVGCGAGALLRELAQRLGAQAYMVEGAADIQRGWFDGRRRVGLTAGASAPDVLVQAVIQRLRDLGAVSVRTLDGIQETIKFPLPKGLKLD